MLSNRKKLFFCSVVLTAAKWCDKHLGMARPKGTPKTNRVTVSFDADAHDALRIRAEQEDVSIAWLIRRAVNDMIADSAQSNPRKRGGK